MALEPCLKREEIKKYFQGREYVTYLDVLNDKSINHFHKLWLLCRYLNTPAEFAFECAWRVLLIAEEQYKNDNGPRQVLEKVRKYLDKKVTKEEFEEVQGLAWAPIIPCNASDYVAAYHAVFAAYYAAYYAYYAAAAAAYAYYAAFYAAISRKGEEKWQLERLKEILESQE